jgi:hypothetical protein
MRKLVALVLFAVLLPFAGPSQAQDGGPKSLPDMTGLWWMPSQPGWGLHLTQIASTIFAAWFTYDERGVPVWYVASNCSIADGECTGSLYQAKLQVPQLPSWLSSLLPAVVNVDPNLVQIEKVGSITIDFRDPIQPVLHYELNGHVGDLPLSRQVFRTDGVDGQFDWNGLWWNPGQSGWGLAITQQKDVFFLAWFTYSPGSGLPTWHVASNCTLNADRKGCTGELYDTGGPPGPMSGLPFDPKEIELKAIGRVMVTFADSNVGKLAWSMYDGHSRDGAIDIFRQRF